MNTGIGDAVNLAWKLADCTDERTLRCSTATSPERMAFARQLVTTARRVRLDIVPAVAPAVLSFKAARRFMFRTISQIAIQYRGSSVSEGRAGSVHGGDRLPWVPATENDRDNFAPLTSLTWQVHVYGDAAPEIEAVCHERKLPLHLFPWRQDEPDRSAAQCALSRPAGWLCGVHASKRGRTQ